MILETYLSLCLDAQPVHKATVIPRGSALGYVMQLPAKDELQWSRKQLLAKMDVCMGGRVAEEMIFGEDSITTGYLKLLFNVLFLFVFVQANQILIT